MQSKWPPRSKDLIGTNMVPVELFNHIAHIIAINARCVDIAEELVPKVRAICQDIVYVSSKGRKQTPKSLALGLTVRHMTGSTHLLQILAKFGHCASSDTILSYETALAKYRVSQAGKVPEGFKVGMIPTVVWDNIDFNEETSSGKGTTHHTNGILIQTCEDAAIDEPQEEVDMPVIKKGVRVFAQAEENLVPYNRVERVGPSCNVPDVPVHWKDLLIKAKFMDFMFIMARMYGGEDVPGWTGYNIKKYDYAILQTKIHYLPVIEASPTDLNTVNTIIYKSIDMKSIFQVPYIICVFDLAIYAKVQEIRWADHHLQEKLVIRLGEFHTCMSFMAVIGKRYGDAGLSDILVEAGVVVEGSLDGVISGHHYNRSIHAYKIVYETMEELRFQEYLESIDKAKYEEIVSTLTTITWDNRNNPEEFEENIQEIQLEYEEWVKKRREENPTFEFFSSLIDIISLLLVFNRATRTSDFNLHLAIIEHMMPWYFAYDRTNYARYLPAYWTEMCNLKMTHPLAYEEFLMRGSWTIQRQDKWPFASIACDQGLEETLNRDTKIQGGIRCFTLIRSAVLRWLYAQPERAEIACICEEMCGLERPDRKPRELDKTRIKRVRELVHSVKSTVCSMLNPWSSKEDNSHLVNISSGAIAIDKVKHDLLQAYAIGKSDMIQFLEDRIDPDGKINLYDTLSKVNLKTFAHNYGASTKVSSSTISKNSRSMYARLLVVSQSREIDMREVMTYCLGDIPFSISNGLDSLVKTNKSALLNVLECEVKAVLNHCVQAVPVNSAVMIDGMALLQSLKNLPATLEQLAKKVLDQVISCAMSHKSTRVDFVTDTYPMVSIKGIERTRRAGKGSEVIKIYGKTQKTPSQFKKFLANGSNKEHLVEFLFETWQDLYLQTNVKLIISHGIHCHQLTWDPNGKCHVEDVEELISDHEEADTRLLLHAKHASDTGDHSSVVIRSPDTDVAIICLRFSGDVPNLYFQTGKRNLQRIISIDSMVQVLGTDVCKALIGLHVYSGCDSTSAFYGKGKKKAYDVMESDPKFLQCFASLGESFTASPELVEVLEEFTCTLYGDTSKDINASRYKSFCATTSEKSLPPCKDALLQHIKRCSYQATIHHRSLQQTIAAPSPNGYGWSVKDGAIDVVWKTKAAAPESLLKVVKCGCKTTKCIKGGCSCLTNKLPCTDMCRCKDCKNGKDDDDEVPESDSSQMVTFDDDMELELPPFSI